MAFDITEPIVKIVPRLPEIIWTLAVGFLAIYILNLFFRSALKLARVKYGLRQLLEALANLVLWLFFIIVLLQNLGLTHAALALSGSLAFLTVALGTGATAFVTDIIAGFNLAKDPDFKVGDLIKIGETEGHIKEIGLRKIRIEDAKHRIHVLPTADTDKKEWVVLEKK